MAYYHYSQLVYVTELFAACPVNTHVHGVASEMLTVFNIVDRTCMMKSSNVIAPDARHSEPSMFNFNTLITSGNK